MSRLISLIVCGLVLVVVGNTTRGEEASSGFTATIMIGEKAETAYNSRIVTDKECVRSLERLAKENPGASVLLDVGAIRPNDIRKRDQLRFLMDVCRHQGLTEVVISSIVQKNGADAVARAKMSAEAGKAEGNVPSSEAIYWPAEVDQMPTPIKQANPVYPPEFRRQGDREDVPVEFVIGRDGKVSGARATKFVRAEFARAAEAAVSKWTFKPGKKGNVPVATRLNILISFNFRFER